MEGNPLITAGVLDLCGFLDLGLQHGVDMYTPFCFFQSLPSGTWEFGRYTANKR
jgi:hypothetical protein